MTAKSIDPRTADLRTVDPRELSIQDYSYELPLERIAQQPLADRDASKLLVYRDGSIIDHYFRDLPTLLPAGALVVLNNTRVINARIVVRLVSGARIEIFCLEPSGNRPVEEAFMDRQSATWRCAIGNAKRWKDGEILQLSSSSIQLTATRSGSDQVDFQWEPATSTFAEVLDLLGLVPLPPYMKRDATAPDKQRYNTIFAEHDGSVAAPTAGLHMTSEVMQGLLKNGITTTDVTLHVGAGTFMPVKSDTMMGHEMHREQVRIPLRTLETIQARLGAGPIIPMGTTALRTLESIYWHGVSLLKGSAGTDLNVGQWDPYENRGGLPSAAEAVTAVIESVTRSEAKRLSGSTALLIAPGYEFRMADALITNFHQPQSTLLLLVAAFAGEGWERIYQHALDNGYRFLSYGDGSLLFKKR